MSRRTIIILIIIVVVLLILFFIFRDRLFGNATAATSSATTQLPTGTIPSTVPVSGDNFPLRIGSSGERVSNLQKTLNFGGCRDANGNLLVVDGQFGSRTEAALFKCNNIRTVSEAWYNANVLPGLAFINM